MVNYQQSKIYKLVSNTTGECYVGSTSKKYLSQRLQNHKHSYRAHATGNGPYMTSFEILATNDYQMILIENYPCNSKDELRPREAYWIKQLVCVNKLMPRAINAAGGQQEYDKAYNKTYRETHGEEIKAYLEKRRKKSPKEPRNIWKNTRIIRIEK